MTHIACLVAGMILGAGLVIAFGLLLGMFEGSPGNDQHSADDSYLD